MLLISDVLSESAFSGISSFLIPEASSKNGRPWQIINIKISLLFIEFPFICLNNLKFVQLIKSLFHLKYLFACL